MTDASFTTSTGQIAEAFDEAWGRADLDGLVALFAEDATLESPLISQGLGMGMVRGHAQLRDLFKILLGRGIRWGRHDPVAVRGGTVFAEYRRDTRQGEQRDAVDAFDIDQGKITSLRVYWGWRTVGEMTVQRPPAAAESQVRPDGARPAGG